MVKGVFLGFLEYGSLFNKICFIFAPLFDINILYFFVLCLKYCRVTEFKANIVKQNFDTN